MIKDRKKKKKILDLQNTEFFYTKMQGEKSTEI